MESIIPTVSRLDEMGMIPKWETAPCEGRNPNIPQNPAGTLTPPEVSTPVIHNDVSNTCTCKHIGDIEPENYKYIHMTFELYLSVQYVISCFDYLILKSWNYCTIPRQKTYLHNQLNI